MSRFSRQSSIIKPEIMASLRFLIIGTGAIGRQVGVQLAAAGAEHFTLFDHDKVEECNIANQGWTEAEIGLDKVEALAETMQAINSRAVIMPIPCKFNKETYAVEGKQYDLSADIVVCAVDSIKARAEIFEIVKNKCKLFVDGRMSAETCRIIAISGDNKDYYAETLFEQADAYAGVCTARSTIYCSNIAGGLMVAMITRWMRQTDPMQCDFLFNIPTYTIESLPC